MNKSESKSLRIWETALLLSLCITMCAGVWAGARQRELSGKMIRLHVLAVSDSAEDQEIKLQVRDSVLELMTPALEGAKTPQEAEDTARELLPEVVRTAREVLDENGQSIPVKAELGAESYPTRHYEDFSLPAGEYTSLRVTLGEGEGQNWWCVVFPPLCMSAVEACASPADSLNEDDISLITAEDEGYVLKFKLLEIYGQLKEKLSR